MEVESTIEIARSAGEVFAVVADMSRNPDWQRGMRECVWTSEPPLRLGSTYDQVARFLGRRIVTSFEVTEFVPDSRIRIVSTQSTFPLDVTRNVESIGPDSCRVSALVKGEPRRMFVIVGPLMKAMVGRSVRRDYLGLKSLLEG